MTLVDKLAEAAAGPDCWLRASPRGRAEYRRGVIRALRVLSEHMGSTPCEAAVKGIILEDELYG